MKHLNYRILKNLLAPLVLTALLVSSFDAFSQNFRHKKRARKKKPPHSLHNYRYGAGAAMGAGVYSGITGAYILPKDAYIQAQLGVQVLNSAIGSTADYIKEFPEFISRTTVPYVGGGVIFVYGDDYASLVSDAEGNTHFGVRAPIGIYLLLQEFPIQLFGEVTPGFLLASETVPVFGVNLGFRWFFE